jgi:hypothetical protein
MKTHYTLALLAAGVLLSGCASDNNRLVLGPVGPTTPLPATSPSSNGTLVVYSAYKRNADFNSRDPYRQEYSDYRIFTADDKALRAVHNNSGTSDEGPLTVDLAPGNYRVVARANGYGYVTVPVVIKAKQKTVLHLEGGAWPDESSFDPANAVRLPDGHIIGWKAAAN